jgi:hypothetical protein
VAKQQRAAKRDSWPSKISDGLDDTSPAQVSAHASLD